MAVASQKEKTSKQINQLKLISVISPFWATVQRNQPWPGSSSSSPLEPPFSSVTSRENSVRFFSHIPTLPLIVLSVPAIHAVDSLVSTVNKLLKVAKARPDFTTLSFPSFDRSKF